jgi:PAS domain S-box-containing protein
MQRLLLFFSNHPIAQKLLLTSLSPILVVALLSILTYQSVQTFSNDEQQVNDVYLTQRKAAEYLRLILDMQSGFRGYVLTRQETYLKPYLMAHDRILTVGDMLEQLVQGREAQREVVLEMQLLVKRLINDKDRLILAIKEGRQVDAVDYVEEGHGRAIMIMIRERMSMFDRLEQNLLNETLANISRDRSFMIAVILGGGTLALVLMVFTLHLIARSITNPLVTLAKTVGAATGGTVPVVPVLDRQDEIGDLTRVMSLMSAQIRNHIFQVEKSEAELRAVNEELSVSESKYRSIVDHAPFGIFTTKGITLAFSNRHNWVLAGLDPDKDEDPAILRDAIHPDDRDRVLKEFAEAVERNQPYEAVFRFLHKDGTTRKVLSRRIPIRDADGKTVMYQGFNIEITALDQMQARLSRAERLATLGQVAAGIAHEIRNPLVGIGSTTAILLEEAGPSDPRRQDLEVILRETRRLDRIVSQIVDYARPRSLCPTVFALDELVHESLLLLEGAIKEKHLKVERRLHPNLSQVQADRDQIKQVLINVFQNAVEAMADGGTLSIEAFDLPCEQKPGTLMAIMDTGSGIALADVPHVFEPFFTTGKRNGTGLGLAICRNIVEAHQGDIRMESLQGVGSTVRIWLPLRQAAQVTGGLRYARNHFRDG